MALRSVILMQLRLDRRDDSIQQIPEFERHGSFFERTVDFARRLILIFSSQPRMAFSGRIRPRFKEELIHMELDQAPIVHPAKRTNTRVSEKK
jgi:hypothetical protein